MLDKAKQDARKRAYMRLEALRKTVGELLIDEKVIGMSYVEELNSILQKLRDATGVNLDEFSVYGSQIVKSENGEQGVEPPLLLAKLNALLEYVGTL